MTLAAHTTAEPLRVLVAEDDQDSRDALQEAVANLGHSCVTARDGVDAWELYEEEPVDVILSDWEMPRMDGFDLCKRIRADASRPYTHFVFITGNDDKAHFIRGMEAGADDFIAKPIDLYELQARLVAAGRVVALNRRLRENNAHLRRDSERAHAAARTDPLTEAFNRLALKEDLETLAARAHRYGHRYCAALFDIDEFKSYNDHFGHLPGDDALRRVARAIHGGLRRGDVFYRYGGEEFLVILPELSLDEAARGMDRVRQKVEDLEIAHAPGAGRRFVTVSVGVSALSREPEETIDGWLGRTDAALYAAKAGGRNRVAAEGTA